MGRTAEEEQSVAEFAKDAPLSLQLSKRNSPMPRVVRERGDRTPNTLPLDSVMTELVVIALAVILHTVRFCPTFRYLRRPPLAKLMVLRPRFLSNGI